MAINLNHDTDTITATSGTLNLPNFSGGGGGGLTHFVESESTASPNATVPVDALTATDASYTNIDVAIVAKGTGAILAAVPDGTAVGGNKRGAYAVDWQRFRADRLQVASGDKSVIAGGDQNRATALYSAVGGGSANRATGQASAVSGGDSNTASSTYSFVGGGQSNTAQTNTHATVCGGNGNTASGIRAFVGAGNANLASSTNAVVCGGSSNTSSATNAFIGSGDSNTASANYATICGGFLGLANSHSSFISGGQFGTTRSIEGYHVFPACKEPIAAVQGVTQSALLLLARETTNATPVVLRSNTNAAGTTNQVILPNNSAYSFSGEVIAGVTGGGDTARWTINGAIKRGASAATTTMVGTPTVTMTHNDAGASGWIVNVTADTTNGGISVTVTGAASTTIRWVAKLNTTEMSY